MRIWSSLVLFVATADAVVYKAKPRSCDPLDEVAKALRGSYKKAVTSFCSDYLHLPRTATTTQTETKTVFSTSVFTPAPVVQTTTSTVIQSTTTTDKVTDTLPDPTVSRTVTVTPTAATVYVYGALRRRGIKGFPSSRISSACSCIVTPATMTETVTDFARTTTTRTSTAATETTTTTKLTTETRTLHKISTVTQDPTTTVTVTVTETAPAPPTVTLPAECEVREFLTDVAFGGVYRREEVTYSQCKQLCREDARCLSTEWRDNNSCRFLALPLAAARSRNRGYPFLNDKDCP